MVGRRRRRWEEEEEEEEEKKKKKTWTTKRRTHKKELQVVWCLVPKYVAVIGSFPHDVIDYILTPPDL